MNNLEFMIATDTDNPIPYNHTWPTEFCYRLERLTYRPGALGGWPEDIFIKAKPSKGNYLPGFSIICSERSSGFSNLRKAIKLQDSEQYNDSSLIKWQPLTLNAAMSAIESTSNSHFLEIYDKSKIISNKLMLYYLDRTTSSRLQVGPIDPNRLALFAKIIEDHRWKNANICFICFSYDLSGFEDDVLYSALMTHCNVYRLPMFVPDEQWDWLIALAKSLGMPEIPEHRPDREVSEWWEFVQHLDRILGGQPRLLQFIFSNIQSHPHPPMTIGELRQMLHTELRTLKHQPPHIIQRWKDDLRHLLKHEPELRKRLAAYVEGLLRHPDENVDASDSKLVLSGWVRHERSSAGTKGVLKIRSECFRQWAIEVLRGEK